MTLPRFFDTHAHLNDARFDPDREEVLRRCRSAGVERIIEIADSPADWDKALALSRARPEMIRCSLGLHPYYADQWNPELAEKLSRKAPLGEVVAVGEIGLDYAKCGIPRDIQRSSFIKMLELADQCGLPAVIHCREAYADMMPILRERFGSRPKRRFHGVLHCFSGCAKDALEAARLGFALGADGPVTYPKNDALREALKAAGLEHLVLETDSPYLPPQSARGKRNDPGLLPEIAESVAGLFGVSLAQAAERLRQNSSELFRLEDAPTPRR